MIDVGKDGVLGDDVIDLAQLDDVRLLKTLHREELARALVLRQHHATKRACSDESKEEC